MRISNKNANGAVENMENFIGSNTFGEWKSRTCYAVYSYGYHFPMYVNVNGVWYENSDKYSSSTSKQQTQLRPGGVSEFIKGNTEVLQKLIQTA